MKYNKTPVLFLLLLLCLAACTGSPSHQQEASGLNGLWEAIPQDPEATPKELYFLSLEQQGDSVTGTLSLYTSTGDHQTATITGTVQGKSLTLAASGLVAFSCNPFLESTQWTCQWTSASGKNGKVLLTPDKTANPPPQDAFINPVELTRLGGAGVPVIFIHGMYSKATTWNAFGLMDKLKEGGFLASHEVWLYQYDWTAPINESARSLVEQVQQAGITSPILVGHSMGGLVARSYAALGGKAAAIITLGAPHEGFPAKQLAKIVKWFDVPGGHDLQYNSPYLKWINETDKDKRNNYATFAGKVDLCCTLAGEKQCLAWHWCAEYPDWIKQAWLVADNTSDGIVPRLSASPENTNTQPLQEHCAHIDLINPSKATGIFHYLLDL